MKTLKFLILLIASIVGVQSVNATGNGMWFGRWTTLCSSNSYERNQMTFANGGTFNGNSGDFLEIKIYRVDDQDNEIQGTEESVFTIHPNSNATGVSSFEITVDFYGDKIKFYNVGDHTYSTNSSGQTISSRTLSGIPADGNYKMKADVFRNNSPDGTWYTTDFSGLTDDWLIFKKGAQPEAMINGDKGPKVVVLSGCNWGFVTLENNSLCNGNPMHLSIQEIDPYSEDAIGSEFERNLTNSEVNTLDNGGLNIQTFTVSGNTITFTEGKTYRVKLTYNDFGQWKSSYIYVQYKSGDYDLVIKDVEPEDNGYEPWSQTYPDIYESPNIWNKVSTSFNLNDQKHEDPDHITNPNNENRLMIEVTNIGCKESKGPPYGTGWDMVRMFWTRARLDEQWDKHWLANSNNTIPGSNPPIYLGSEITISGATMATPFNTYSNPFDLPQIQAGNTWTMPYSQGIKWYPPDPANFNATNGSMASLPSGEQRPIICLLARINDQSGNYIDPLNWEPSGNTTNIDRYVRRNNNVATRNTMLYDNINFAFDSGNGTYNHGFGTVLVGNESGTTKTVSICVERIHDGISTSDFSDFGTIEVATTNDIYAEWINGGSQNVGMSVSQPTLFNMINTDQGCISNINIQPDANEIIGVRFNIDKSTLPTTEQRFAYRISMTYADGSSGTSSIISVGVPTTVPIAPSGAPEQVSIENPSPVSKITLFPNPTSGNFTVTAISKITKIEIYSVEGKLIDTHENINNVERTISTRDLNKGIYTVKVLTDKGTFSEQFVKQ